MLKEMTLEQVLHLYKNVGIPFDKLKIQVDIEQFINMLLDPNSKEETDTSIKLANIPIKNVCKVLGGINYQNIRRNKVEGVTLTGNGRCAVDMAKFASVYPGVTSNHVRQGLAAFRLTAAEAVERGCSPKTLYNNPADCKVGKLRLYPII